MVFDVCGRRRNHVTVQENRYVSEIRRGVLSEQLLPGKWMLKRTPFNIKTPANSVTRPNHRTAFSHRGCALRVCFTDLLLHHPKCRMRTCKKILYPDKIVIPRAHLAIARKHWRE
jgi:hypothetical protein